MNRRTAAIAPLFAMLSAVAAAAPGAIIEFGDRDLLNTGATYATDPTAGASLVGLPINTFQFGSSTFSHTYPFSPTPDDFPGTDEIHTAANQSAFFDGYSQYAGRIQSPVTLTLDYSSLVPAGHRVDSITLGVMADDFQFPSFGQPFQATINGSVHAALTTALNTLDQTGPYARFVAIGLDPSLLSADHVLTLTIAETGNGRDGFAIDFATIGITTSPVPEPGVAFLIASTAVLSRTRPRRSRCA